MRRLLLLPLAVLASLPGAAAGWATPATPAAPTTAWYDASYPTATPKPPPAPPGVSDGDLVVEGATATTGVLPVTPPAGPGTVSRPVALSALSFAVPGGAMPASLTLELGSAPSTATAGAKAPTGVAPVACPLTGTFRPGGHQPYDQAPAYDCAGRTSQGHLSGDGTHVVFSDIGRVAQGKRLAFVLVPGTIGADRLVFLAPKATALSLLPFDTTPAFTPTGRLLAPALPATPVVPAPTRVANPVAALPALGASLPAPGPGVPAPSVASSAVAAPAGQVGAALQAVRSPLPADGPARTAALVGLGVLTLAAAGLLVTDADSAVGATWRAARALATGGDVPPVSPAQLGVGRFRAVRQGPAPLL